MTTTKSTKSDGHSDVIEEALKQNTQVADDLKETAEELGVVHAVLDKKLAKSPDKDVGQAVARTQELEERLNESVEALEATNEMLAKQAGKKGASQ